MQVRFGGNWQGTLWKIVTNPAIEVIAAIVVVLVAAWFVIDTDSLQKGKAQFPVPLVAK
jgi:hypothetical protein